MTRADDIKQYAGILTGYEAWRAQRVRGDIDLSVSAYLDELATQKQVQVLDHITETADDDSVDDEVLGALVRKLLA